MKAIERGHTTHRLGKPGDWDEARHGPCMTLPATYSDGVFYSYWKPTWRERFHVLFGRPVRLCVAGSGHPPVGLDTED
jgi:hypothetical protein